MKNRTKIFLISFLSVCALLFGISAAYYNTRSLAFDGEPIIFSVDEEKITFLDFNVTRNNAEKIKKFIEKTFPEKSINLYNDNINMQ